jgi:hypothetical protein
VAQNADNLSTWSSDYSRRPSISTESYCSSGMEDIELETEPEDQLDDDQPVVITDYYSDREQTPVHMPDLQRQPQRPILNTGPRLVDYRHVVQERPPPTVSMARRRPSWDYERPLQPPRPASPSWQARPAYEDHHQRPLQPPRPASRAGMRTRTQEAVRQPPRPASRASASAAYYEGRRGHDLSRSPSATSTSTMASEMSSTSSKDTGFKGRCPHCYIHSWLPHSPLCPKKK